MANPDAVPLVDFADLVPVYNFVLGQRPEAARAYADTTGVSTLVPLTDEIRDDQQQADLLRKVGELPVEANLADQSHPR